MFAIQGKWVRLGVLQCKNCAPGEAFVSRLIQRPRALYSLSEHNPLRFLDVDQGLNPFI